MSASWDHDRLVVAGEFDMDNAAGLRAAIDAAIADQPDELVVDAAALEFCDSTCLACILRALQAGLRVRIVRCPAVLRRALAISGIDQHPSLVVE